MSYQAAVEALVDLSEAQLVEAAILLAAVIGAREEADRHGRSIALTLDEDEGQLLLCLSVHPDEKDRPDGAASPASGA